MFLLYLSIIPCILLGIYIYHQDKVEKEPTNLLIRCLVGGVIAALIVLILSAWGVNYTMNPSNQFSVFLYSFLFVGFVEEGFKFLMTYLITYRNQEFNYLYDSIVYTSFIALGFAIFENILYIMNTNSLIIALIRGVATLPAHVFFAVFMGYYLGISKKARIEKDKKREYCHLLLALLVPTLLHGFFDYCLFTENPLGIILFCIFVFILYISAFQKVKELSKIKKSLYE